MNLTEPVNANTRIHSALAWDCPQQHTPRPDSEKGQIFADIHLPDFGPRPSVGVGRSEECLL